MSFKSPFLLADFRSPNSAFWSQRFKEIRPEISPRFLDPSLYRGFETGCSEFEGLENIATNKNRKGKGLKSRMLIWFWEDVIYLGSTPLPRIHLANGVPCSKCKNSGGDWHPGLGVDPKYITILGIQKKLELYKYAMCSIMRLLAELPQGFRFRSTVQLSKKILQTAHPEKLTACNASWKFGPQHSNPFDFQFPKPDVSFKKYV